MYAQFYGFKEKPFSLLPDPDFLYYGEKHRAALDLLELAVLNQSGFCLLSGEIGAGKTTLIRALLNRLDENVEVGLVSNTHPSFGELLQWVMAAYGLQCQSADRITLHNQFIDFVIRNYAKGKRTLLIIDEAQNLSTAALEELRMLSNVNSGKDMVLQVMLVGQQQLRNKLRQPDLEQFIQRIGVDFHLTALSDVETREYIRYRIRHVGGNTELFSDTACQAVHRASMGVPRLINRICDLALVYAFSEQLGVVEAETIKSVVVDQQIGDVLEAARTCKAAAGRTDAGIAEQVADIPVDSLDQVMRHEKSVPATVQESESNLPESAAVASEISEHADRISELHRLVVAAEEKSGSSSQTGWRKPGLKLAVALSVVLGGVVTSAWLSHDIWSAWAVGDWYRTVQARIRPLLAPLDLIVTPESPALPVARTAVDRAEPDRHSEAGQADELLQTIVGKPTSDSDGVSHRDVASAENTTALEQTQSVDVAEPVQSDIEKLAGGSAEIPYQAVSPVKNETSAEQKQVATESIDETPVSETAITDDMQRRESERLARLQEKSRRLERERRAAERKFAEQLKARLALEQKAREERGRMLEAKAAVVKAAAERQRVERAAVLPHLEAPSAGQKARSDPGPEPIDSQSNRTAVDQEHQISSLAQTESPVTRQSGAAPESAPGSPSATGFQANPCDGPTARFMSTCVSRKP